MNAKVTSKTLIEVLQPSAKRLKPHHQPSVSSLSKPSSSDGTSDSPPPPPTLSDLTPIQLKRIEINKSLARSKRNLRICSERVSKARADGLGYVKLEELLVEETWLEALPDELQQPYAKNLCRFIENEVRGTAPIYPPPFLIFNALHSTPFDRVKAVIIGQDPYHGPGQALGLSFSVPDGVKAPSSLVNIFKELQKDLGCSIPSHGNLERWAVQWWCFF